MDDETLTNIDNLITPSLMKHSNWLESYIPTRANPLGTIASEHSTIGQAIAAIKSATLEATLGLNDRHSTIGQAIATAKSSALEATLGLNDRHSTIGQAIAAAKSSALEATLGLNDRHSTIDQAIAAAKSSALEATLGLNDRHSTIGQAIAAIKSATLEATSGLNDRHSTIGQAIAAAKSSALEATLGLNDRHSTIGQAIAAIKSATLEATLGLNDRHSTIDQALAAIKSSALEATLDLNDRHSTIGQAIAAIKSAKLETTLGLNATKLVDIRNLDISSLQEELGRSDQQQFNEVNDIGSFIKIINSLPSLLQDIFYYLFIYVVIAQINSISANLLTPFVESYLKDNKSAERIQIKTIKRIPLSLGDVDTDGLRFIAGNNVRLRSESSTRSEVLDELVLGQIVTVLSKSRNWIEVKYEYEDGDAVSGWVFTRYTAKFVK